MSTSQQLQQAFQLIKNGQRQEAAQILVPIVRAEPNNADAWWLLANAVTNEEQQRRALEKVLSIRPGDDRAQKKLSQLTGAPPPPPPSSVAPTVMIPTSQMQQMQQPQASSDPFGDDPFADIPARGNTDPFGQPATYRTQQTPAGYGGMQTPPPAGAYPPSYGATSPYGAPPPPVAPPPPKKRGCNCCLVVLVLFLVAIVVCVGSLVFAGNQITNAIFGVNSVQEAIEIISGTRAANPNSIFGQAMGTAGISSMDDLFGTATAGFGGFSGDVNAMSTQAMQTANAAGFSGDVNAMSTQAMQTANAAGFSGDVNAMSTQAMQTANALGFSGDANAIATQAAGTASALGVNLGDTNDLLTQAAATLSALGGSLGSISTDLGAPLQAAMYTNRGALAFDSSTSGNVAGGSGDLWTFEGTAGQTVIIDMREDKDSGLDPLVLLYGPDNTLVASDDDGGEAGFDSLLEFELPASGTYTLIATSFGSSGGAYTLVIR